MFDYQHTIFISKHSVLFCALKFKQYIVEASKNKQDY